MAPMASNGHLCGMAAVLFAVAAGACGRSPEPGGGGPDAGSGRDASVVVPDGTPVRRDCTDLFGSGLSAIHGRLDGILVSVVPESTGACNNDPDHLHLQVEVAGEVYDVAINISDPDDVDFTKRDFALPGGPWVEGWHSNTPLDYVALGLHADQFDPTPETTLRQDLLAELASVNHIAVFMTGYGPTGGHDVHRRNGGNDGALFLEPLSTPAHGLFFHFANQAF